MDHGVVLQFAGRVLGTWGSTARALTVIVVVVGLALLGLWTLDVRLDLGPLHLGPQ